MAADYIYRQDQAGPPIGFRWLNYNRALYDFTVGTWVFTLQVVTYDGFWVKQVEDGDISGSPGSATDPNVVIDWPANFFSDIPVDQYMLHLSALDADSRPYFFSLQRLPTLQVIPAPLPMP